MGSNGSKEDEEEDGLPARYARGCSSTEFSNQWGKDRKYKIFQQQLNLNEKEVKKSSVSIQRKISQHDDPSVQLLDKPLNKYNLTPRLQSFGNKPKSYINQLIELRTKNTNTEGETVKSGLKIKPNKPQDRDISQPPLQALLGSGDHNTAPLAINNNSDISNTKAVFNDPTKQQSVKSPNENKKKETSIKRGYFINQRRNSMTSLSAISTEPSSSSWSELINNDERCGVEGRVFENEGLEQIRSDMTVVPYIHAKARFETGRHSKKPKKNEAYSQLEQLGLGFWSNDQWVPTKVVTLAISDQLSSAGGEWPANYRQRNNNFSCQNFRTPSLNCDINSAI